MTPREKFIKYASHRHIAKKAWDAMMMASTHDPDHAQKLKCMMRDVNIIFDKLHVIERQIERLGAPQYRKVYAGRKKS
jgi:hypothetical protein